MSLRRELRDALRSATSAPWTSALIVLVLALGIGATTALVSLVDGVLFRDLPIAGSERVYRVFAADEKGGNLSNSSHPVYRDYVEGAQSFASLAAFSDWSSANLVLPGGRSPERVTAGLVSGTFFSVLGLVPAGGRLLSPADEASRAPVVVVSHRFATERLSGVATAPGTILQLNGTAFTVAGVAPRGFHGLNYGQIPDVWVPLTLYQVIEPGFEKGALESRTFSWLDIVGRLAPGVSPEAAKSELATLSLRRSRERPADQQDPYAFLLPAVEAAIDPYGTEGIGRAAWMLAGLVALVVLVTCADVAGLLLARSERRRWDLGVRLALGATPGRLVRSALLESLLLATAGGILGVALAGALLPLLSALPASALPFSLDAASPLVSLRMLAFALVLCLSTALLFGVAPALAIRRVSPLPALRGEPSFVGGPLPSRLRPRDGLTLLQFAFSFALVVAASLLTRTLLSVLAEEPGFSLRSGLLVSLELEKAGYDTQRARAFWAALLEGAERLPGVTAAALCQRPPIVRGGMRSTLSRVGGPPGTPEDNVEILIVTPRYFETLGLPILAGRGLNPGADSEMVLNEVAARHFFGTGRAIGASFTGLGRGKPAMTVVGVAANAKMRSLRETHRPAAFLPLSGHDFPALTLHLRSEGDPAELVPAVRALISRLDPSLPIFGARTVKDHLERASARERLLASLALGLAGLALLLSAAGIYGLVAQDAESRKREFAIRLAVGARPFDLMALVRRRGLLVAAGGALLGLALAAPGARALAGTDWLYGVSAEDPVAYAAAALVLFVAALLAGEGPARRAARVEPSELLRES
ncbi:MAG: ABC transporter permease [Acidobacteria bacterium]|nr:ABC transporter permease [Acidobacteriota bacterium]